MELEKASDIRWTLDERHDIFRYKEKRRYFKRRQRHESGYKKHLVYQNDTLSQAKYLESQREKGENQVFKSG